MVWLLYLMVVVVGYFLGSIPTGFLFARARGIDIRAVGSGNIGATNAFRVLGRPLGATVLVVDVLKGILAGAAVPALAQALAGAVPVNGDALKVVGGIAAVLGHNYTCWLNFSGGKGVATTGGVLLAWVPGGFLLTLAAWLIVFAISRYVSLASLAAACTLAPAVALTGGSTLMTVVAGMLGVLGIFKHRSNIQRLLNGTEPRVGRKTTPTKKS
ncbi:MAG: glycerol-3-phosphate 1-O-acyltransferase PlsY [Limisphaerales bacterium]